MLGARNNLGRVVLKLGARKGRMCHQPHALQHKREEQQRSDQLWLAEVQTSE
jgi:hypothetical protein